MGKNQTHRKVTMGQEQPLISDGLRMGLMLRWVNDASQALVESTTGMVLNDYDVCSLLLLLDALTVCACTECSFNYHFCPRPYSLKILLIS